MIDFEEILNGVKPTEIFYRLRIVEPELDNSDLARRFVTYFDRLDGEALQTIWYWNRPPPRGGLSDVDVDSTLTKLLRDAGYTVESR